MNNVFIKNFYYNKSSIIKLIYLYNFLFNSSFLEDLLLLIERDNTLFKDNAKKNKLIEIYSQMSLETYKKEYSFGDVYFKMSEVVFFFKKKFDYYKFIEIFNDLESELGKKWSYIEVYDKNIKIIEVFEKTSIRRSYRNEVVTIKNKNKSKVKFITNRITDLKSPDFLKFIQKYDTSNIKLVVSYPTS